MQIAGIMIVLHSVNMGIPVCCSSIIGLPLMINIVQFISRLSKEALAHCARQLVRHHYTALATQDTSPAWQIHIDERKDIDWGIKR